jgi:hypothetical protein
MRKALVKKLSAHLNTLVKEVSRMSEKVSKYYNQVASEQSIASEEKKGFSIKSPKPERREDTPIRIVENSQEKSQKLEGIQNLLPIYAKSDPYQQKRMMDNLKPMNVKPHNRYEDSIRSPYLQVNKDKFAK